MLQETPEDLVRSWAFFRSYYLNYPGARWYKKFCESPPMHYQMIHDMGNFSWNVWGAPRNFSKSTVVKEMAMLLVLTRENFTVSMVMCTIKKYRKSISDIMYQFQSNARLREDFEPYFGEPLKAKRGSRLWGTEILVLPNKSTIEGGSVEGALRGDRPDLLLVDDPEYDEDAGTDLIGIREKFEVLLFHTLLPMLSDGCGMFWIGTLISKQSFLYQFMHDEDARYKYFNRRLLAILDPDGQSVWSARWSLQAIEDKRTTLGESAFLAEMMNQPGESSAAILKIDPSLCTYEVEGRPDLSKDPFQSTDKLTYRRRISVAGRPVTVDKAESFGDTLGRMFRMITVDYIRKPSATSDYAAVGVWGFDNDDTLWVLDLYLERVTGSRLTRKILEMALRWKAQIIGLEAVATQEEIANDTKDMLAELSANSGYCPRTHMVKYAKRFAKNTDAPTVVSKAERIAAMESRFGRYKIKFPAHRKKDPAIAQLWYQCEAFSADLSRLRWDDAVDSLAMSQYVPRHRGKRPPEGPEHVAERMSKGEFVDPVMKLPYPQPAGMPYLTDAAMAQAYARKYGRPKVQKVEEFTWPNLMPHLPS